MSVGRLRFVDIQHEVYMLRKEHEKALRTTAKCQDDLKEAGEMVKCWEATVLEVEKEMEHVQAERDRAQTNLTKA